MRAALIALAIALIATPALADDDSAISPDGRWKVSVRVDRPATSTDDGQDSLWLTDTRSGASQLLFRGAAAQKPERNLATFEAPRWSLDGGFVYINADAWATSSAVHQINVRTGAERYVIDGWLSGVIRTGPYRGYLLVGQHRYWPAPRYGSYNPVSLYRPDGKRILMVPGSDKDDGDPSVEQWLKAKGWTAS